MALHRGSLVVMSAYCADARPASRRLPASAADGGGGTGTISYTLSVGWRLVGWGLRAWRLAGGGRTSRLDL